MNLYNTDDGEWRKTPKTKYFHYFDPGKKESLCNLSKNATVTTGDFPKCPICRQFYGIRQHLVTNQNFKFKM